MTLDRIQLSDFRNIKHSEITLAPQLNIIIGPNGSGKTSLLESIYFLSHGRSFRTTHMKYLIADGCSQFNLFTQLRVGQTSMQIGMSRGLQGVNENSLDGNRQARAVEIAKKLPVLCLTPEHLSISGAKFRIKALDWLVFYLEPGFAPLWSKIKRLIRQRNSALKSKSPAEVIDALDQMLIPWAEAITKLRQKTFQQLQPHLDAMLKLFLPQYQFDYYFDQGWSDTLPLGEALMESRAQDRRCGSSQLGPHRADWQYQVNHKKAKDVLSRGQYKLLICAQTLALGAMLEQSVGFAPIVLLDDVCAELDRANRQLLVDCLLKLKISGVYYGHLPRFFGKMSVFSLSGN